MPCRRALLTGAVGALAVLSGPASAAVTIRVLEGELTIKRLKLAANFVFNNRDKIVGLRFNVMHSEPKEGGQLYANIGADKELLIYKTGMTGVKGDDIQLLIRSGFQYVHGSYVVNGYYIPKFGGMYQGILAYYFEAVSESQVLLSGAKLTSVPLR